MTDQQLLVLSISIIIPLSMLIYSNSRITEAKETLRAEMSANTTKIISAVDSLSAKLRLHEMEHHK